MWFFYALISTFTRTIKDVLGKKISQKNDEYLTGFSQQFFPIFIFLPVVLFLGIPEIKSGFYIGLIGALFITPIWPVLYMRALKYSAFSSIMPMMATLPIFGGLVNYFFDGTVPNLQGWAGIMLISVGLYFSMIDWRKAQKDFLYPFRLVKDDVGVRSMLVVSFLWSLGAQFTKLATVNSSPLFSALVTATISSVIIFLRHRKKKMISFSRIQTNFKELALIGTLNGAGQILVRSALNIGYAPYVIAVRRLSIVWSTLYGWKYNGEDFEIRKAISFFVVIMGLALVILS